MNNTNVALIVADCGVLVAPIQCRVRLRHGENAAPVPSRVAVHEADGEHWRRLYELDGGGGVAAHVANGRPCAVANLVVHGPDVAAERCVIAIARCVRPDIMTAAVPRL